MNVDVVVLLPAAWELERAVTYFQFRSPAEQPRVRGEVEAEVDQEVEAD